MARRFEPLVQEDLNVGTSNVWIHAPGGGELYSTQVGLHSFARGQKAYTTTWAPGTIGAVNSESTTIAVPDAAVGDFVMVSHDKILTSDLQISGNISAAGTAQVVIYNPTTSAIAVASGTLSVLVFPVATNTGGTGIVTGTCYADVEQAGNELASVAVVITALGLSTTSAANGTYSFTGVAPGSVTVDGTKLTYTDGQGTGTVDPGQTTVINLVLAGT